MNAMINGKIYDWSAVSIDIDGQEVVVKELTYSNSLEPGEARGNGSAKLYGRSRGTYSAEGSMTVFRDDYGKLIQALGTPYMEKVFDVTVMYGNEGDDIQTDRLIGCRMTSEETGGSEGGDPLEVSVDLHIMSIEINGLRAVS